MAGLVPAIHVSRATAKDVEAEGEECRSNMQC